MSSSANVPDAPRASLALAYAALVLATLGLCGAWLGPVFDDWGILLLLGGGACAGLGMLLGLVGILLTWWQPAAFGGRSAAGMAVLLGLGGAVGFLVNLAPFRGHSPIGRNESATIGDLRSILSAEIAYASENGGFFDRPECLVAPKACRPTYEGPTFLSADDSLIGPRRGYVRTFYAGAPAPAADIAQQGLSMSSIVTFAIVAVPVTPNKTGFRSFCADSTGIILFSTDGRAPRVRDGACVAEGLIPLQ